MRHAAIAVDLIERSGRRVDWTMEQSDLRLHRERILEEAYRLARKV
jgi:hypothetical protein